MQYLTCVLLLAKRSNCKSKKQRKHGKGNTEILPEDFLLRKDLSGKTSKVCFVDNT